MPKTNMNDFLGIAVVGAALSGLIEWLKTTFRTTSLGTKLLTIVLAIVIGALYVWLHGTPVWSTILGVLAAASTVYAFLLK